MKAQKITFAEPTLVDSDSRRWRLHAEVDITPEGHAEVMAQVSSGGEVRTLYEGARIATRETRRGGRVTGRTYQGLTGPRLPIVGAWERTIRRAAQRAAVEVAWRAIRYGSPIVESKGGDR